MNSDITVIVNSCDSYSDLWNPFFTLFKKYWPDCPYKIILNTESLKYNFEGLNIEVCNVANKRSNVNIAYGRRLKDVLKKVSTEYVLILLDDFFIREPIDNDAILECLYWMDYNKDIALISFESVDDNLNLSDPVHSRFVLRPKYSEYKINLQAGLWRKQDLFNLLKNNESPWEFELLGNIRAFSSNKKFYALASDCKRIINYRKNDGQYPYKWGVVGGKWVVDTVAELFEDAGLSVDYSHRGIYSKDDFLRESETKLRFSSTKLKKSLGYLTYLKIYKWGYIRKFSSIIGINLPAQYIDYKRNNCNITI